jgi:DNA polymerase elongation subunit (family B)
MNKYPVINIYNKGNTVYIFCRDEQGKSFIRKDEMFRPYYYEPDENGMFKGYDGTRLEKIIATKPSDLKNNRSNKSFESDINYTKRYLIDNVEIIKAPIRWQLIDVEVQTEIFPDVQLADKPISCVSIYDNFDVKGMTFWLPNYKSEYEMIERLIKYIKERQPDLLIAFNGINFDFPYLFNRHPDFAKNISPIEEIDYYSKHPAGIACVDYYQWDKKMTLNRRKQYTLDYIAEEEVGMKSLPKVNFNSLDIAVKDKNIYDLKRMLAIERKKHYIDLFNDIRILSKCLWGDMDWNSHLIDQLLLQEAHNKGVILPKKPEYTEEEKNNESDENSFEGAYREAFKTGLLKNISVYDLGGAYLYMILDLCLDSSNISDIEGLPINVTDRVTNEIKNTYRIKQNQNALLPCLIKKLIQDKIKYKELKDATKPGTDEAEDAESKYNAMKSVYLSAWGCIGNRGFRLFDPRIAGLITSNVRDLIHYVKMELYKLGQEIVYIDTDSCMIADNGKDNSILLNSLIQKWAKDRFNKESSIKFEYQGTFEKLLVIALCHYSGLLRTDKGIKVEEKGIEGKKKDATVFMAETQRKFIDMILNEKSKEEIIAYKEIRIKEMKEASLFDIALPAKIAPNKEYTNEPIFVRALRYSELQLRAGDLFYWIYCEPFGAETQKADRKKKITKKELKEGINPIWTKNKKGDYIKVVEVEIKKPKDIIAFTEDSPLDLNKYKINWQKMAERNITMKLDTIFGAMGWIEKPTQDDALEELKRRGLI